MINKQDKKKKQKSTRKVTLIHVPNDALNDTMKVVTIGRNELCPCGSGKKVKNCCKRYKEYYYTPKKKEAAPSITTIGDKL